jgi:hypothetical protein
MAVWYENNKNNSSLTIENEDENLRENKVTICALHFIYSFLM